jgi:uncharacterized protein (TIGR01777 family)
MNVVITGATGFIGRPLCAELTGAGHTVTVLSRDAEKAQAALGRRVKSLAWGERASNAWRQAVREAEVVIHLAGESVGGRRWTPEVKRRIRASRVETTRALVKVLCQSGSWSGALICASAVGYYGDCKDQTVTEETPSGSDFLSEVCREWEAEAHKAEAVGARVACMRLGIVLGKGGALEKMLTPLPVPISPWKLGLGGPLGNGRQWMPWIHLDDVVGLFLFAATHSQMQGAVNVTAPNPVTNATFTHTLGRVLHRPAFVPVPGFALRMLLGEFAATVLGGQKALPTVALAHGYPFRFPDLEAALRATLTARKEK